MKSSLTHGTVLGGLPVIVSGIVFWGMVLVGLFAIVFISREHEKSLRQRIELNGLVLSTTIEEHLDLHPHENPLAHNRQALATMLANEMEQRGFHAVELHDDLEEIRVGEPFVDADVHKATIRVLRSGELPRDWLVRLRFYYPDFKKMITEKRNELFVTIGAVVLLFAFVLQQILQRVLSRPIMRMVRVASQFAAGNKEVRFDESRRDELGYVARFINNALDTVTSEQRATRRALQQLGESQRALQEQHDLLEQRVEARTEELSAANRELEAYSYSIAHDLRQPLRAIDGFSLLLLEDYADQLDAEGKDYLRRVRDAAQRMGLLIDDILKLSKITRSELVYRDVDVSALVVSILQHLRDTCPERNIELAVAPDLSVKADHTLFRVILENLLGNAWKYTSTTADARIAFGSEMIGDCRAFYVRDNGVGFDESYSDKLYRPFERLHTDQAFEGTGIGLATVARAVHRMGGEVWAESSPGHGATFYFTLTRCRHKTPT